MKKLRIKSKATLQKMRDEGVIKFSQPEKKIILYDADSINDYLEKTPEKTSRFKISPQIWSVALEG